MASETPPKPFPKITIPRARELYLKYLAHFRMALLSTTNRFTDGIMNMMVSEPTGSVEIELTLALAAEDALTAPGAEGGPVEGSGLARFPDFFDRLREHLEQPERSQVREDEQIEFVLKPTEAGEVADGVKSLHGPNSDVYRKVERQLLEQSETLLRAEQRRQEEYDLAQATKNRG